VSLSDTSDVQAVPVLLSCADFKNRSHIATKLLKAGALLPAATLFIASIVSLCSRRI